MLSKVYETGTNKRTILFRDYLRNWRYFSLSPLAIRLGSADARRWSPTQSGAPPFFWWTACDPDGSNLSDVLFILKSSDDRRYLRLIQHVKMIEPSLEGINFIPAPGQPPVPFVALGEQSRASWHGLSDGTLRVLGLALIIETAAACSPPTNSVPALSVIEEPENGIFPGVVRQLFDLFEEWSPTSQYIFTSHSPYFIDMFDSKREWVTILRKADDRTESFSPPRTESENGERLGLAAEYASELYQ
jgi:predicted ATPase